MVLRVGDFVSEVLATIYGCLKIFEIHHMKAINDAFWENSREQGQSKFKVETEATKHIGV
ncbi:hypothetical protein SLEP1_g8397 [Rubroshorea leprosula]|uniref:Uncharacterized protein n=1 Tax=Rubroshorea leprosula TaxID=152421 RepID=A0AAV5IBD4_9ROSI|nr:hypothetical protein SLEP1_g8397 [Rubroshorea leprosula]